MTRDRVPILIIAGFLGSGKTTLINHLLATGDPDQRVAVVVNDFGQINVDAQLIEAQDEAIVALRNGCVCCSLGPQLLDGLSRLLEDLQPDYIVIEGSGVTQVGKLRQLLGQGSVAADAGIERVVAVVDSEQLPKLTGAILTVDEQIRSADVVILNRCDQADESQQKVAVDAIQSVHGQVPIIKTVQARITLDQLRAIPIGQSEERRVGQESGHLHREHQLWETVALQTRGLVAEDELRQLLGKLPPGVFRGKGFVATESGAVFAAHAMPDRVELTPVTRAVPDELVNRLIFIGHEGTKTAMLALLQGTAWTQAP